MITQHPYARVGARHRLDDAEQRLARYLATARHQARRSAGAENGRRNPAGDGSVDLEGIAAELAFCHLNNVYPDLSIGVAPEADATLPGGITVDVKATAYPAGNLLCMPGKAAGSVDLYALMIGTFPGPYRFAGVIGAGELIRPERLFDVGHGQSYSATQDELGSIASWFASHRSTAA